MSKVVWCLGGWSNDHGNSALQVAITKIIRDRCSEDLQFVYIDNQSTLFSDNLIGKMNAEADMLLITGCGVTSHRLEDGSRSGWKFNIELSKIADITVPIVAYGVGYTQFPFNSSFIEEMWPNVQETIDNSALFSVRNTGTYDSMVANGIDASSVTVVPDASMFITPYVFSNPCLSNDKLKIGFNWPADRWEQRFTDSSEATNTLSMALGVLKEKAQEHNAYVYLIEHLMPDDTNNFNKSFLKDEFKSVLGSDGYILTEEAWEEMYPPFDYQARFFADIYGQMDLVVGMRPSSNIISFGQNIPTIGIGQHYDVKWFLDDIEQTGLNLPLSKGTEANATDLRNLIDDVITNSAAYKSSMNLKKEQLDVIKNTFVDQIAAILEA